MDLTNRLSAALTVLRWGPNDVAERCSINERTVRRWLAGQNPPSVAIVEWLERLVVHIEHNPPPR